MTENNWANCNCGGPPGACRERLSAAVLAMLNEVHGDATGTMVGAFLRYPGLSMCEPGVVTMDGIPRLKSRDLALHWIRFCAHIREAHPSPPINGDGGGYSRAVRQAYSDSEDDLGDAVLAAGNALGERASS